MGVFQVAILLTEILGAGCSCDETQTLDDNRYLKHDLMNV